MSPGVSAQVAEWLSLNHDLSLVASATGLDPFAHENDEHGLLFINKTGRDAGIRVEAGVLAGPRAGVSYALIVCFDDLSIIATGCVRTRPSGRSGSSSWSTCSDAGLGLRRTALSGQIGCDQKTIVWLPWRMTRSSACQSTARESTWRSTSAPRRARSATVSPWVTRTCPAR